MIRDFIAIDFETANQQPSSVCSIGVVMVRNETGTGTCFIKDKASDYLLPENDESQQEDKYLPFE
jgi:hypothetical protein